MSALPIKLIVTDLDGTLLDDDHVTVPAQNAASLRRAREEGARVVIATGRTYSSVKDVLTQIDCDYVIISNGAAIVDAAARTIYREEIPHALGCRLIQALRRYRQISAVFCEGRVYMDETLVPDFRRAIGIGAFAEKLLASITLARSVEEALQGRDIEKVNIEHIDADDREAALAALRELGPFTLSNSFGGNIEINAAGVTKGRALQWLCGQLGIARETVMAFGDSSNDIEMLRWAGLSYAMENAAPSVKAAAKYRAPRNTEAGLSRVIDHLAPAPPTQKK
jgi:Cof subfamily protein (haloacid dehalogenase superfamily)